MKHAKKLLACLLAGVLALAVFTACDGMSAVASAGTDAEQGSALAERLGVAYAQDLENAAKNIADWIVEEPSSLQVSGMKLARTVTLDADNNMGYTDDLNWFLRWSGCDGVPEDGTIAISIESTAMVAWLYIPQADSTAELAGYAKGCSEMGAAFIEYNGTTYVVAVFR